MNREIVERYVGKIVRIRLGDDFVPPPGIITMIVDDESFLFETKVKTSVLPLDELKEISPVV